MAILFILRNYNFPAVEENFT